MEERKYWNSETWRKIYIKTEYFNYLFSVECFFFFTSFGKCLYTCVSMRQSEHVFILNILLFLFVFTICLRMPKYDRIQFWLLRSAQIPTLKQEKNSLIHFFLSFVFFLIPKINKNELTNFKICRKKKQTQTLFC